MTIPTTLLTPDDLQWGLGSQDSRPYYLIGCGDFPRQYYVDPYPAYPIDVGLVKSLVADCGRAFPLKETRLAIYVLSHESAERTNGSTFVDGVWKREDGSDWVDEVPCGCGCGETKKMPGQANTIVLSAKRIPVHPAMVRYLVAHEYGHAVFNHILRMQGYDDGAKAKVYAEYMSLRGTEDFAKRYSGGKWHVSPGEIIANDFRVGVMGAEPEFWPHPTVSALVPGCLTKTALVATTSGLASGADEVAVASWWRRAYEVCGV